MASAYPLNWDLDCLYPNPGTEAFAPLLKGLQGDLRQLAEDSETLPSIEEQPPAWGEFLTRCAAVLARYEDLGSFIGCHCAADAGNKPFQRIEGQLSSFEPHWQQVLTNMEFALRDLSADALARVTQQEPRLADIRFYLEERQRAAASARSGLA